MNPFNFAPTPHIHFGENTFSTQTEKYLKGIGNILIITCNSFASNEEKLSMFQQQCEKFNVQHNIEIISGEPSPDRVDEICQKYIGAKFDKVIGIGGGSAVDAGKAIAAMLNKEDSVKDYLEGIGKKEHDGSKVPYIAVPTTSGTGSEMTKNAVLSSPGDSGYKKSLRHDNFIPNVAIIDTELIISCPAKITAASGLDALTQLVESYLSSKSSSMTDALALDGIRNVLESIETAVSDGSNREARAKMAYGAMLSGITLANAGLGLVHGLAGVLGGYYRVPHGFLCGKLMGVVNKWNLEKAVEEKKGNVIAKYARLGELLPKTDKFSDPIDNANLFINKILNLIEHFELSDFSEYGIKLSEMDKVIKKTGLKNNPVDFTYDELHSILGEILS